MLRKPTYLTAVLLGAAAATAGVASAQAATAPIGAYTTKGAYSFVTDPNLHPPKLSTSAPTNFKKLAAGYFMIANFKNLNLAAPMVGQGGPLILDSHLQPVWFSPVGTDKVALDLKLQTYNGQPALSWWQGVLNQFGAASLGQVVVVDQHYRPVTSKPLEGQDGWIISVHDVVVSGRNAWVTAYKNVANQDLTSYGGPATGIVYDSAVQEYSLTTGKLLYSWSALAHLPLSQSVTRPAGVAPWDAYHVNSVQLQPKGKFLVSMRNTSGVYLVDIKTGHVDWTLGAGAASTFTLPAGATFHWQHDAQLHAGNVVSVFDDACCAITGPGKFGPPNGPSRGLVLKLDLARHTGKLVRQYVHFDQFNAAFLGSTELAPNGNVMIGWGSQPAFSEYSEAGAQLLDAVLPSPNLTYRAFVEPWVGLPFFPPRGAVSTVKGKVTVYASWDGSTQVGGWRVLAGPDKRHLAGVAVVGKRGFETLIRLTRGYKTYQVQALDSRGHVLRSSPTFSNAPPPPGFY